MSTVERSYDVRFEGGHSICVFEPSLEAAVVAAKEAIASCVPPALRDLDTMMRTTVARETDACGLCGRYKLSLNLHLTPVQTEIGMPIMICRSCIAAVGKHHKRR